MKSIFITIFLWLLMLIHLICHDLSMPVTAAITTTTTCFLEIYQRCFHVNGLQKIGCICSDPMNDICHFKFSNRTKIDAHLLNILKRETLRLKVKAITIVYWNIIKATLHRTSTHNFFVSAMDRRDILLQDDLSRRFLYLGVANMTNFFFYVRDSHIQSNDESIYVW